MRGGRQWARRRTAQQGRSRGQREGALQWALQRRHELPIEPLREEEQGWRQQEQQHRAGWRQWQVEEQARVSAPQVAPPSPRCPGRPPLPCVSEVCGPRGSGSTAMQRGGGDRGGEGAHRVVRSLHGAFYPESKDERDMTKV